MTKEVKLEDVTTYLNRSKTGKVVVTVGLEKQICRCANTYNGDIPELLAAMEQGRLVVHEKLVHSILRAAKRSLSQEERQGTAGVILLDETREQKWTLVRVINMATTSAGRRFASVYRCSQVQDWVEVVCVSFDGKPGVEFVGLHSNK